MIWVNVACRCEPKFLIHDRSLAERLVGAGIMINEGSSRGIDLPPGVILQTSDRHLPAAEPPGCGCADDQLRRALAECETRLHQKDELIQRQELLKKESDHRLLNDLQIAVSLLSLQSRESRNAEVAAQLSNAANRVAMIAKIHHRLNSYDGVQTIEIKKFLEDLGRDFSAMVSSEGTRVRIVVEGTELVLSVSIAIPLGFVVSELITNAAKYGKGLVTIRLEPDSTHCYALSVCNDGPPLPEGFDPDAGKGLGMRIVRSFVRQIGGELKFAPCANGQGARFTVLFCATSENGGNQI